MSKRCYPWYHPIVDSVVFSITAILSIDLCRLFFVLLVIMLFYLIFLNLIATGCFFNHYRPLLQYLGTLCSPYLS